MDLLDPISLGVLRMDSRGQRQASCLDFPCSDGLMIDLLQLGEDSDYDKLSDMVKYLDLELHFGTQKPPSEPRCQLPSAF